MSLLYVTLLVGATFFWGWFFYKKEYHPQPLKVIIQSFIGGTFSMLPVFGYKFVYEHYLPRIAEYEIFQPLLKFFVLEGMLFFALNLITLSVILIILASLLSLILTFFKHQTLLNIYKALKNEELEFVTVSMMIGLLIFGEGLIEKVSDISIINTIVGSLLFLVIIEEYIKHLVVRFLDDKKIKEVTDAITFSVMVGLAFSAVETVIYAINLGDASIIVHRILLSMPIHIIASGIFGYYYGLAHFAKPIEIAKHEEKTYRFKLKWLHKILTLNRSTVYEEEKMIEGLFFATLFHVTANVLFELNLAFISVPLIILGLLLLSHFYKESHFIYRLLHPKKH